VTPEQIEATTLELVTAMQQVRIKKNHNLAFRTFVCWSWYVCMLV
jgi:hypothetical protein